MNQVAFAWTALPSMELRGLGTSLVEPIDYYVLRMSWTTGWSVPQLASLIEKDRDEGLGPLRPNCYNFSERRKVQITALEQLTGVPDLRHGTLWVLKEVLNSKGLYRICGAVRRWCPLCYEQWDADASWEPLIWSIPYVSQCPIHGCDLMDKCPACGQEQSRHTPIGERHQCGSCGASLGGQGTVTERPKFYRWVDGEISKLVAFCSTPGQEVIPRDTLLQFAEQLEMYARDRGALQKVRRCLGLQYAEAFSRPITFSALINLAALLGVSVVDLLTRPRDAMSAPLLDLWGGFHWLCDPFARKGDIAHSARWLAKKLLAQKRRWFIPSMRVLMKDVGVSPARFREFDPETYQAYMDAYVGQCGPSGRYTRGLAFTAARKEIEGMNSRHCTHGGLWWLPEHVKKRAPGTLEDVYYGSHGAIAYWRLFLHARSHAQGAMAAKEDIRWIESAPSTSLA